MKYLLFETLTVNNAAYGMRYKIGIKKDFFILEVSDDVKIIKDRYHTVILCSDYDINQDLPADGRLQYESIRNEYKITIISHISKNMNIVTGKYNYFIDIFDTRDDAELYYNLEE